MSSIFYERMGFIFKKAREEHNWTQADVSNIIKVSRPAICNWEMPREKSTLKLLEIFAIYTGWI
ncbi:MAG: helix-turn-helix transcriptional regulator [Erysipelotrichaceae bacterium]|nr:helix-turn-helix transcriptional regulator [Erysipelotrichaceae bacterium]